MTPEENPRSPNPEARIMDANLNRAGEALRTAEEYARFILESPGLSARAKALRHDLARAGAAWMAALPAAGRPPAGRDIAGDVGAAIREPDETGRADARAVARAALRRAAEALRVLSEYGKIADPAAAAGFEEIRYGVYALEPAMLADAGARGVLARARLYVLITGALCSTDPLAAAREAVDGGADAIQMREKEMEDGEFLRLASAMNEICRRRGALFIVNDRPHIASLIGASGVHGGQGDLPPHLARRLLGHEKIVGVSTSAPELAEKALAAGADYIGVGPVYETGTKPHRRAVGLEYVSWAANWGKLPFFAIGSINRDTIRSVVEAGARAVAICTAITRSRDIAGETAFFKGLLPA
ncbi:MAG: thiamine phosphate synthase [Planctomycetota bacterium]|jgi:thiamine-phosphate pyrophosphorylase|nr:thiamine phosphate synthase [Planctomycetota bacterium]